MVSGGSNNEFWIYLPMTLATTTSGHFWQTAIFFLPSTPAATPYPASLLAVAAQGEAELTVFGDNEGDCGLFGNPAQLCAPPGLRGDLPPQRVPLYPQFPVGTPAMVWHRWWGLQHPQVSANSLDRSHRSITPKMVAPVHRIAAP